MDFMGKAVDVNLNAGLFVTLNPAGKGYGGRSKLPDNLQQMFRCVLGCKGSGVWVLGSIHSTLAPKGMYICVSVHGGQGLRWGVVHAQISCDR